MPAFFGAIACSGSEDETAATPPGTASTEAHRAISAITPNEAFVGRSIRPVISGSGTAWEEGASVDFGDGIQVDKVVVASPASLVVTAVVSDRAALGPRDVHVSSGAETLDYAGGFYIVAPLAIDLKGTQAQGSELLAAIQNLDTVSPFDTTAFGDGVTMPLEFPNLTFAATDGVAIRVTHADAFALDLAIRVDATAPAGARTLNLASGSAGGETHFVLPDALTLEKRTAQSLAVTSTTAASVAQPYASLLYQLQAPSSLSLVEIQTSSQDAKAAPTFALLPASGVFGDAEAFSPKSAVILKPSEGAYVVSWDGSGASGYDFEIDAVATTLTSVGESEPNDDALSAQSVVLAFYVQTTLSSPTDEDWFAFAVGPSDVGKRVRVRTDGDPLADTWVDVLGPDGTTSLGGPSSDATVHEDFRSDPIAAAGTYYVKVMASPYFDPAHGGYTLLARFEGP